MTWRGQGAALFLINQPLNPPVLTFVCYLANIVW
ncbi:hypothetical protein QO014_000895 [Kaistia dalseonensis]|uniref:Uncharacterized protein n=1 Tax=Kaistia dalseonensis TaxID=410840 RepID=A0ABU0H411_9HYPH|nr:hypothetical protein [Kaistia dalseonensis]